MKTIRRAFKAPRVLLLLCLVGSCLFLNGCATALPKPAVVTASHIENKTIGYKGYKVDLPEGFSVVTSGDLPTEEDHPVVSALKAHFPFYQPPWISAVSVSFVEYFLCTSTNMAIWFEVGTLRLDYPFSMIKEWEMRELVRQIGLRDPDLQRATIKRRGDITYAHLSEVAPGIRQYPEPVAFEKMMIVGRLNEIFFISAVGPPEKREEVQQLMARFFESLTF